MLWQCSSLAVLNLFHIDTGAEGAGRLAGVLGQCSSLAVLNLFNNDIGAEGAGRLAGVLGQRSTLAREFLAATHSERAARRRVLHRFCVAGATSWDICERFKAL